MKKILVLVGVLSTILISGCISVHKECCEGVNKRMEQLEQRVSDLESSQSM